MWGRREIGTLLVLGSRLNHDYHRRMPVFLESDRCTACCRWPGEVRLTDDEIKRMTNFLGHSENEFIERYTRLTANRSGLALSDKANGECIFLSEIDCRVQPVKPKQCRAFPNLWNFPGFEKICRARPIDLSASEYGQRIAALKS